MTRSGSLVLAPLLAAALLAPAAPRAGEPDASGAEGAATRPAAAAPAAGGSKEGEGAPPAPDAPEPAAPPPAPPPPKPEDTWIDAGHAFIEQRVFAPILRLDRFFSDERAIEAERSQSFLRWRSEVRFAEDASRPALTTGLVATLRLLGLNQRLRRLRIVIAGETRDAIEKLFPKEPAAGGSGAPAEVQAEEDALGNADAGLRFYLWDTLASHADLGGGFLLQLPPGVYGRLRLRWAFPVGPLFAARTAVVGFWRSDAAHFGVQPSVELDRPIGRSLLVRLTGGGTASQASSGFEWSSELAAIVPLPPRAAAQIGFATSGATRAFTTAPDPTTGLSRAVQNPQPGRTRVYARLRRDMYRRWFFIEIEPEVAWPWSPERGRYSAWGLSLRAEVQFQGKERAPPAPPPPPPEPRDPPS